MTPYSSTTSTTRSSMASANNVVVDVLRGADKNELKELLAVGKVHVHQNGEKPQDKGIDITGETLSLFHFLEGDVIKVLGDTRSLGQLPKDENYAQLQLDE